MRELQRDANGNIHLTLAEGAMVLKAALERKGWRIGLNQHGQLHAVVGDPLEGSTVAIAMEALNDFAPVLETLLAVPQGVH